MADAYVDGKVREALIAARGSRTVAQNLLMTWAATDDRLLRGMAQPFLKAVTAAAVEGVVRRSSGAGQKAAPAGGARLSRDALEQVLNRMGEEPPPSPRPSMQSATMVVGRGMKAPEGATHENAMLTLAKAFAAKKHR